MAICKQQNLDKIFHALGDATRRDMLAMLSRSQYLSANELAAPFNIAQPTASKHIKVLEQSALIERKIEGRTHYFQIKSQAMDEAEGWLNRHREFWMHSFGRLDQLIQNLPKEGDN